MLTIGVCMCVLLYPNHGCRQPFLYGSFTLVIWISSVSTCAWVFSCCLNLALLTVLSGPDSISLWGLTEGPRLVMYFRASSPECEYHLRTFLCMMVAPSWICFDSSWCLAVVNPFQSLDPLFGVTSPLLSCICFSDGYRFFVVLTGCISVLLCMHFNLLVILAHCSVLRALIPQERSYFLGAVVVSRCPLPFTFVVFNEVRKKCRTLYASVCFRAGCCREVYRPSCGLSSPLRPKLFNR